MVGVPGRQSSVIRSSLIIAITTPAGPTFFCTQADNDSLYNTPPCYGIYICGKVFKWLKKMGGLSVLKERNEEKAKILYDFLEPFEYLATDIDAVAWWCIVKRIIIGLSLPLEHGWCAR